jgi:hypothetical protein
LSTASKFAAARLGTEGLVVDLAGSLDQILKVGAGQEIAQVDEFTDINL